MAYRLTVTNEHLERKRREEIIAVLFIYCQERRRRSRGVLRFAISERHSAAGSDSPQIVPTDKRPPVDDTGPGHAAPAAAAAADARSPPPSPFRLSFFGRSSVPLKQRSRTRIAGFVVRRRKCIAVQKIIPIWCLDAVEMGLLCTVSNQFDRSICVYVLHCLCNYVSRYIYHDLYAAICNSLPSFKKLFYATTSESQWTPKCGYWKLESGQLCSMGAETWTKRMRKTWKRWKCDLWKGCWRWHGLRKKLTKISW